MRKFLLIPFFLVPFACSGNAAEARSGEIRLPPGFEISVFAEVPNARSMTLSDAGVVYVGNRGSDKVWAVVDRDGDGKADERHEIASGLESPNGVAWHDGDLYVAEISRILRFDDIDEHLENPPKPVVVTDDYPDDGHHGWKFIAFGPDGKLYVPIGAPCNICDEEGYAVITRINPDGTGKEIVARGIRNTVGFDWDPETGDLWFTDNGRDWLGDNRPDDELNHVTGPGQHFGYPYCHAGTISDPEYGEGHDCNDYVAPAALLGPHVAALGMRFYDGEMFPEKYRGGMFIAQHGSWNRSEKSGYRVVFAQKTESGVKVEPFATGWLQGQSNWGRPVDVLVMPDGALLVSDDSADVIYRISYDR
ncbi:MAG TPA: sorbosone dehydrogenase family protein [Gammaproteobacteria bacterium]